MIAEQGDLYEAYKREFDRNYNGCAPPPSVSLPLLGVLVEMFTAFSCVVLRTASGEQGILPGAFTSAHCPPACPPTLQQPCARGRVHPRCLADGPNPLW